MSDTERAKTTLGYLKTYPTTIVIDKREIPAPEVTAIYENGRGLGDVGEGGQDDARQRLATALGIDPGKVGDAGLDAFLRFVDDKWAKPPPPSIPPGKIRWIELEGFTSEDNPLGVHDDCATIFELPDDEDDEPAADAAPVATAGSGDAE